MDRQQALSLWKRYNDDESLLRHALSVEAAMRHFAKSYGEDVERWGAVGLLHDLDYQRHPDEHLVHTRSILTEAGLDEEFIRAVESHGWGLCTQVEPRTLIEKTLYAVDELTGFIAACAYVRPSKSVLDMEVKSVKKKWGSAAFAAGVNRGVIEDGAARLGISLDELIAETIMAMRAEAEALGLKGSA